MKIKIKSENKTKYPQFHFNWKFNCWHQKKKTASLGFDDPLNRHVFYSLPKGTVLNLTTFIIIIHKLKTMLSGLIMSKQE